MYAIIRTGGNQYRVQENDEIEIEKLDIPEGESFEVEEILAIGDGDGINVGFPYLKNAKVEAELLEQGMGDEVIVFKYKPKKKYRKKNIHQQPFSRIRIKNIELLNDDSGVDEVKETILSEVAPEEEVVEESTLNEVTPEEDVVEEMTTSEATPEEEVTEETTTDEVTPEGEAVEETTISDEE